MGHFSTKKIVLTSFVVNTIDVIINLVVAIMTGSAIIFAETVHGIVDSIGSFLLVVGYRRSNRPSDSIHPFGYKREMFFWALLSSMVMFFLGSGLSIRRGFDQLYLDSELHYPLMAASVLVVSFITNGYSFYQSFKKISIYGVPITRSFAESSQQLVKTSLLRDGLGTLSSLVGMLSIFLYWYTGIHIFDGLGAIVIGLLMAAFSIVLIRQTQQLITGKSVSKEVREKIFYSTKRIAEVHNVNRLAAVYTGGDDILVDLDVDLKENLTTNQIEKVLDIIKEEIMKDVPQAKSVQIDLNSPTFQEEVKITKS